MSAAASSFSTKIRFTGDNEFHLSERSIAAAVGRRFDRFSVRAIGGAILGGALERDGERHDVGAGWLAAVNAAGNWTDVGAKNWFLGASLTIGVSSASTSEESQSGSRITSGDVRATVLFGHVFAARWSPYVVARGFFGPVKWRLGPDDVTGSDVHHYAVGLGGSLMITPGLDVFAEEAYFGERSLTAGAGLSF